MTSTTTRMNRRAFLGTTGAAGLLAASPLAAPVPAIAAPATPVSRAGGIEAAITATMEATSIPGATVLVAQGESRPWIRGFGVADIEAHTPMDPAMHMRIGSITKTVTATAVLQLVDEGVLSLDDTLASVLPERSAFPNAGEITIRQMLNMRSGVFEYLDDEATFMQLATDPTRAWTPDELVDTTLGHDPYFAPGEDFRYSNTNYILLGMIVSNLTELPIAQALDRQVFAPLGMAHTSLPDEVALPDPFARGYGVDIVATGATPAPTLTDELRDWTELNPTMAGAAGGIVSTAADLHIWLRELMQGTLLSEELQQERLTFAEVETPSGEVSFGYGLGVGRYDGLIGHDGSIFGYEGFIGHDPGTGTSIISLINVSPSPAGASGFGLAMAVREALAG